MKITLKKATDLVKNLHKQQMGIIKDVHKTCPFHSIRKWDVWKREEHLLNAKTLHDWFNRNFREYDYPEDMEVEISRDLVDSLPTKDREQLLIIALNNLSSDYQELQQDNVNLQNTITLVADEIEHLKSKNSQLQNQIERMMRSISLGRTRAIGLALLKKIKER